MFSRQLTIDKYKSCFIFGPRQSGKSTYVKGLLGPKDLYINLLLQSEYVRFAKEPGLFRNELLHHFKTHGDSTCVVDEIQRIPDLLNEVHALIESTGLRFILTGSSARKLRRGGVNLLAGRAYTYRLFPLLFEELGDAFDMERALRIGVLPTLWRNEREDPREFLRTYTETYLREEIKAEGLVRNIGPFARFLDIASANDGEIVNFSNIARECQVSVKTAKEYYQILEDTFIAYKIEPWRKSVRKRLVAHSRYYFFDPGVTNALCKYDLDEINPIVRGHRFEQLVITQLLAKIEYRRKNLQLNFWRSNTGLEVDLIISKGKKIYAAVEIKSGKSLKMCDINGLTQFLDEHPGVPGFAVTTDSRSRKLSERITVMPWKQFLTSTEIF